MGKYGNGISFGSACSLEKAEIKRALNGEILAGEDETGRQIWVKGSKEETDKVIIDAYDELYYQAEQLRASGCAMDKIHGELTSEELQKYMVFVEEEHQKHAKDYIYD